MNRKNLIELMTVVAASAALFGCASAPTRQQTAQIRPEAAGELDVTRNAWATCVRAAIPRLDDLQSSSGAVARAAMKGCSNEYATMVRALSATLGPTCSRESDCTRDALAEAQREATQAATDDVVTARVRVAGATVLKCE